MISRIIITLLLGLSLAVTPKVATSATLTLDPVSGAIAGNPGDTIGWGFTFTNTTDYAVITQAHFNTLVNIGTFTDFTVLNFYLAGAPPESATLTQPFDLAAQTGIGSFLIDSGALPCSVATGSIGIIYDLYSLSPNDPLFDPGTDLLSAGNQITADASVSVLDAAPVPEPSTLFLLGAGLAGVGFLRRMRRKS